MKDLIEKTKINIVVYKIISILLVLSYLIYMNKTLFDTPKYGDSTFFAIVSFAIAIFCILPYLLDKIVISLFLIIYTIYNVVQVCYEKMFEQYLYIKTALSLFDEAKEYTSDALELVGNREIQILILCILTIVIIFLLRSKKDYKKAGIYLVYTPMMLLFLCLGMYFTYDEIKAIEKSNANDIFSYNQSDRFIYDRVNPKKTFVEYFGINQLLFRDIKDNFLYNSKDVDKQLKEVENFMSDNLSYQENDMTGFLKDKHLFVVQGESLTKAAISKELTPTLYKLMNEGWDFDNFYSPLLNGSTSDVETMVNLSLIPINDGTIVSQTYDTNLYKTTLANGFKENGYIVSAYHNNYKIYYNRENYFPSLGYDIFLDSYGLGLENQSSDKECSAIIEWISVFNEKDFSFWVTYSGHQPYGIGDLNDGAMYPESVSFEYKGYLDQINQLYPELDDNLKLYLAKNMSLDRALSEYIRTYEMMGNDKLVILLYGDHHVKGLSDEMNKQIENITGYSIYDTPLILWYPGINHQVIDKYCTDIDILPTIFNLYDIKYDKTDVLGNDIFDDRYNGFKFTTTWNIFTNNYTYYVSTGEYDMCNIPKDEADKELNRYLEYQNISNYIFINDYYKYKYENENK